MPNWKELRQKRLNGKDLANITRYCKSIKKDIERVYHDNKDSSNISGLNDVYKLSLDRTYRYIYRIQLAAEMMYDLSKYSMIINSYQDEIGLIIHNRMVVALGTFKEIILDLDISEIMHSIYYYNIDHYLLSAIDEYDMGIKRLKLSFCSYYKLANDITNVIDGECEFNNRRVLTSRYNKCKNKLTIAKAKVMIMHCRCLSGKAFDLGFDINYSLFSFNETNNIFNNRFILITIKKIELYLSKENTKYEISGIVDGISELYTKIFRKEVEKDIREILAKVYRASSKGNLNIKHLVQRYDDANEIYFKNSSLNTILNIVENK